LVKTGWYSTYDANSNQSKVVDISGVVKKVFFELK
jgi:hypothetical protein